MYHRLKHACDWLHWLWSTTTCNLGVGGAFAHLQEGLAHYTYFVIIMSHDWNFNCFWMQCVEDGMTLCNHSGVARRHWISRMCSILSGTSTRSALSENRALHWMTPSSCKCFKRHVDSCNLWICLVLQNCWRTMHLIRLASVTYLRDQGSQW